MNQIDSGLVQADVTNITDNPMPLVPMLWLFACDEPNKDTSSNETASTTDSATWIADDTGVIEPVEPDCEAPIYEPYPFISEVIDVTYGEGAGFGQSEMPDVVFGPPLGFGDGRGSMDVVTLGHEGHITLGFELEIIDDDGPDFIVFENPFIGWLETGIVSASLDGETWYTWDCDVTDIDNNFPGCAGANPVESHPDNCIDARDWSVAGGDVFDLADIGLESARYIRIADSGANTLGGFDLDAVVIIHGVETTDIQ